LVEWYLLRLWAESLGLLGLRLLGLLVEGLRRLLELGLIENLGLIGLLGVGLGEALNKGLSGLLDRLHGWLSKGLWLIE
jgi:hypothetical protein